MNDTLHAEFPDDEAWPAPGEIRTLLAKSESLDEQIGDLENRLREWGAIC